MLKLDILDDNDHLLSRLCSNCPLNIVSLNLLSDFVEEQIDCLSPILCRQVLKIWTNSVGIPYHKLYFSFTFSGRTSITGYFPILFFNYSIIWVFASFKASTCRLNSFYDSLGDRVRKTNSSLRIIRCASPSTCATSILNIFKTSSKIWFKFTFWISCSITASASEQLFSDSSSSSLKLRSFDT